MRMKVKFGQAWHFLFHLSSTNGVNDTSQTRIKGSEKNPVASIIMS